MDELLLGFGPDGRRVVIDEEARALHMHVIGSTGSGKSKFLEWMIRNDIQQKRGLCLIDPHGDLYDDILRWCARQNYLGEREIVLFDPSAGEYVTGFNPFDQGDGEIDAQVNRRILATLKAWGVDRPDQTPTLERWLRCIFWTLIEKKLSIVEAQYLISLENVGMIEALTAGLANPLIAAEWQGLLRDLKYSRDPVRASRDAMNELLSTRNRLFRLLTSPSLMTCMGQLEHRLDLAEIMERGKVLLVNLKPSDRLDDLNGRLLGTLLVNQLYETARRRERLGQRRRPFYLYLDEFQNFVTHDIDRVLAEGRKMGLHMILAHQDLSQVAEAMSVSTLLGTARNKVVFGGLNRQDAVLMVEEMFAKQIDLQEIKEDVTQTKFFPREERRQVVTRGRATTSMAGHSSGLALGDSFGTSSAVGSTQGASDGWFGPQGPATVFSSMASASGRSESRVDTQSEGWAETESEAVADVPFLSPEPFQEATQTYTLEEQKWRLSDALKEQATRFCFVKISGQETIPMQVPRVEPARVFETTFERYRHELLDQSPYCLPEKRAQETIAERQRTLLLPLAARQDPYPDEQVIDLEPEDFEDIPSK